MNDAAKRMHALDVTFGVLSGDRPVVVLAPHPDDESLGCGALLAHAFAGPGGHVVCMTDGAGSHPGSVTHPPARLAACRAAELDAAVIALGGRPADITRLALPDAGMGEIAADYDAVAARIADLAGQLDAGLILTTAPTDPHCDHVATAEIGRRAARRAGLRCLFYPIWSRWADPNFHDRLAARREYRLASAAMRERKRTAIAAHASQLGGVVRDDPEGFILSPGMVAMFVGTDEMFFECDP